MLLTVCFMLFCWSTGTGFFKLILIYYSLAFILICTFPTHINHKVGINKHFLQQICTSAFQ